MNGIEAELQIRLLCNVDRLDVKDLEWIDYKGIQEASFHPQSL